MVIHAVEDRAPRVCGYFSKVVRKLLANMPGVEIDKIGFDKDHLHMVMVIPPKYSIAEIMGSLKSQSSSMLHKKFPWLKKYTGRRMLYGLQATL